MVTWLAGQASRSRFALNAMSDCWCSIRQECSSTYAGHVRNILGRTCKKGQHLNWRGLQRQGLIHPTRQEDVCNGVAKGATVAGVQRVA